MADNVTLDAGSGGDTIAADDVSGVKYQVVKIDVGADGAAALLGNSNPIPVSDAGGALTVDNGGTFAVQAAQSGSWSATVTNAGTFAVQVDGAALTALQLIDNIVLTEDAAHQTGDSGVMPLAVRNDTLAALAGTDGDYAPLQVDANGAVYVNVVEFDNAQVDDAAFTPATDQVSVIGGFCDETGTDSVDEGDAGALRMTARRVLYTTFETPAGDSPWDDTNDALQVNVVAGSTSGTEYTEDAAAPANPVGGTMMMERDDALGGLTPIEGDWTHPFATAEGALWVQDFNSDAILADTANMDTNLGTIAGAVSGTEMQVDIVSGTVDLGATDNAVLDSIVTNTDKGTTHYRNIDANAEDEIKGSAGTLHWIHAINLTNAIAYLHLYDAVAANVTPGTTTPDFTFPVPTTGTASQGGGFNLRLEHAFANGITLVCTTTTDGSTGDPGTNGVMVNAGYT